MLLALVIVLFGIVALCQILLSLLVLLALVIVHLRVAIFKTILYKNYSPDLEIEYFKNL